MLTRAAKPSCALARSGIRTRPCGSWAGGGAALEQQAEDAADIARQVKTWDDGRRGTVAIGISMGAISLRYALASAVGSGNDLGVRKYISINGPHRGAWISPDLTKFLLKHA